jgi:hypothetical protein
MQAAGSSRPVDFATQTDPAAQPVPTSPARHKSTAVLHRASSGVPVAEGAQDPGATTVEVSSFTPPTVQVFGKSKHPAITVATKPVQSEYWRMTAGPAQEPPVGVSQPQAHPASGAVNSS